ncbi:hypothetical protein BSKO_06034 [Bryopsis sp. KO-2023]|nr:hypothetical protein BSKO_06034 [Bryopsis sp. KO-2023]
MAAYAGRGALGRAQDIREKVRREKEMATEDVRRYYAEQRMLDVASDAWQQDDMKRRERHARERQAEKNTLQALYKDQAQRQLAAKRAAEEDSIASELSKQYIEQQRKEREVQSLREQSEELRELAEKIRAARVNKERHLQKQERAMIARREEQYKHLFDKRMEDDRRDALEKERLYSLKKREDNLKSRKVLEDQMQEKEAAKRNAQLEYDKEKILIDEVVRRIEEEDALEAEIKRSKQEDTKAFIRRFLEERQIQHQEKLDQERAEDMRIARYLDGVRERESAERARKQAVQDEADRIYDRLCREKQEEERRREEEAGLLAILREEEAEQKRKMEVQEKKRKDELARQEMIRQNEIQMRLKAERDLARKAEEDEFRQRMLEKFAEDDRIDQLNAQRRRLKQMDHRREVDRLVAEKRAMYEELKRKEAEEEESRRREEDRKAAIIEYERQKLLEEAAGLHAYLPKGVIRDKKELDFVNSLAQKTEDMTIE